MREESLDFLGFPERWGRGLGVVGVEGRSAAIPWLQRKMLFESGLGLKLRGMCFVWKEALFLCLTLAIPLQKE